MDPDLLRVLVPLGIFAFWALTKLSERGPKPVEPPPRLPPPVPNAGPRNSGPITRSSAPPMRFGGSEPARRIVVAGEDEIVILSDARPQKPGPSPRKPGPRQKSKQPKPKPAPESATKSMLGVGDINQMVSRQIQESMSIKPMRLVDLHDSMPAAVAADPNSARAPERLSSLVATMRTPGKLRDALILNEILQPPLSRRKRR
ncbi:MAG: hypothetical protein SFX72_18660 [Isosphaeraceae bacterium]|nr:hypothetical protein [Isosphaeraceae bacterium]